MATVVEHALSSSMENWSLKGPYRLIKVLNTFAYTQAVQVHGSTVKGYVTQAKFIKGMNVHQVERALGLRFGELGSFARVCTLTKLPAYSTVEYRWFASFIGGRLFDDAARDDFLRQRDEARATGRTYNRSHTPVQDLYWPGDPRIPQWELTQPVPIAPLAFEITPSVPYQEILG